MTDIRTGFLLTHSSHDRSRHTEVVLWVVTDKGPARLVVEGEQPVFFVLSDDQARVKDILVQAGISVRFRSLPLKTFAEELVSACYFLTQELCWQGRKVLARNHVACFEADFRLHNRYLMERFIHGGLEFCGQPKDCGDYIEYRQVRVRPAECVPNFRVLSLDVECSEQGELYSVGLFGHGVAGHKPEGLVIMVGPRPDQEPDGHDEPVVWVADESALLRNLVETVNLWNPDILIGWNVINFDFRLLLKRAQLCRVPLLMGRGSHDRQRQVSWRDRPGENEQGFVTVPGRVVIDGIESLRAATWHFDSFSLEYVSQTLLGRGKITEDVDERMAAITRDFHHDKYRLARYNLEDCRLVWDIFEHTHLLDYLRLRSHLTGLEMDRLGGSVAAFTNLYLPRLHRAGYIAPNLPEGGGLASPGGYVMNSLPGLYDNVLVLDFKSLYPSIIRTFKIDPMGLVEGLKDYEQAIPGFRGARFSREKHFLPDIIASLWQQRDEAKKEQDAARSQALKIIMNSFYGVLGSGGCRFYDTRLASSITMRGHGIMQQTAGWIEAQGYKVIYGDTDSTFVLLGGNVGVDRAEQIGRELEEDINRRWQSHIRDEYDLECYLELEFETLYTRFLMPTIRGAETGSKKRYAGLKKTVNGSELVFKGLETVRSDWTPLAKVFQTELFSCVFSSESPEPLVMRYVQETQAGLRDEQLVYRKRLRRHLHEYVKNIPPQVRAARLADEKNAREGKALRYQHKSWISYVMTTAGPEAVEHHHNPLDYQHYIEKQLKPVAEGILPFVGLSFDQMIDGQQGLF